MNNFEIISLEKYYGSSKVLSLSKLYFSNGIYGLMGKNAAGKSTFIRAISGLIKSESEFKFNKEAVNVHKNFWRSKLGYLPQSPKLFEELTVYNFCSYMLHLSKWESNYSEQIEKYLSIFNLQTVRNKLIRNLSGGIKQRVSIIQAMIHEPKILLLDEPCNNLDVEERHRFHMQLLQLSRSKIIFYIGHIVSEMFDICKQIMLLEKGSLVFKGSKEDFKQNLAHMPVFEFWDKPLKDVQLENKNLIKLEDLGQQYKATLATKGHQIDPIDNELLYQLFVKNYDLI